MKVEYSRLLGSLTSSGMVRVSLRYGMIYDLKVKSYYDKLELVLVPRPYNPEEQKMRSPQSMYFGRTYMRNLFPDFAISMRYQKGKLFIRSMQLQFILFLFFMHILKGKIYSKKRNLLFICRFLPT